MRELLFGLPARFRRLVEWLRCEDRLRRLDAGVVAGRLRGGS